MKLWLVRHAEAVEATAFSGGDLERPLTPKGKRTAKRSFARLAKIRRGPDLIIHSEAVRARETARLLASAFRVKTVREEAALNPGCSFTVIRNMVNRLPPGVRCLALVGHEPDFSRAAAKWTSDGTLHLALKKGGLIEIEFEEDAPPRLLALIPPDLLAG